MDQAVKEGDAGFWRHSQTGRRRSWVTARICVMAVGWQCMHRHFSSSCVLDISTFRFLLAHDAPELRWPLYVLQSAHAQAL